MIRRFASTGRYRRAAPLDAVPLLAAALHAKSEAHRRGHATRRARRAAAIVEHLAALRRSILAGPTCPPTIPVIPAGTSERPHDARP